MHLWGPVLLRLLFRTFVVVVGFLILSGAVNTAIIGSNGVLNRVSEDGVLSEWFRRPHNRFGTTYRIINLVVLLQIFTIVASRGNVYWLGEAYAFGVIWSFTFNSLAMLVLRYKYKGERGWKVPPNLRIAGREIPIGLASVFLVLLAVALVNLFTKAVSIAESFGKKVSLLLVPARDVWSAIVQTESKLESSAVVAGGSSKMTAQEQAFQMGRAWEASQEPKRQFILQVVHPDRKIDTFHIGPHTPSMKTEDVHLVHRLWLNITREPGLDKVHHHDILTEALTRFARDYAGRDKDDILKELKKTSGKTVKARPVAAPDGKPEKPLTPLRTEEDEPRDKSEKGPPSPPIVSP